MKKVTQSHGENTKPVKLYLDDLEEIIEILKGACDEIEIQCGDMMLDSLDELLILKKEVLHDLKICGRKPYISADMSPRGIWLFISEDTAESRGLFEKVKTILLRCRRPFTWFLHNSFLTGIAWPLTLLGAVYGFKVQSKFMIALFGILFVLSIFWAIYGFQDWSRRYTVVIPKHRIESPGFAKRNRDKILLAVISALIGAMVTYFFK